MNPTLLLFALTANALAIKSTSESASASETQPTITVPEGSIIGAVVDGVEYYRGIPYAQPPVGSLRLRPPVRLESFGSIDATGVGPACPQMTTVDYPSLLLEAVSDPAVARAVFLGQAFGNETEDCLTISVMRPQGTAPNAKLPVLFWIYGGGFELGSAQPYNASVLIPRGVEQDKPFIFVAINYRVGGFGFLGGSELLAEGSVNLGLLDQRMGLEWVADNIAAFGGDPDAVTIWGESAGSFSVFQHLGMYDGNNTYKGRALFRAGIMNSGSIVPADRVDGPKAQLIFDAVSEAAGCSSEANTDKLACLRGVSYETYLKAANSVPFFLSYNALSLSYMPRPDGKIIPASSDVLAANQKYAAVPVIIGDVKNEGTIFSVYQSNITTKEDLVSYLQDVMFHNATREQIIALVDTYDGQIDSNDDVPGSGSVYPEFQRLAAILGDIEFTLMRRIFLSTRPPSMPAWSFLTTWDRQRSILEAFHTSDMRIFYDTDDASTAFLDRYIAFVTSLDPNDGVAGSPEDYQTWWPTWHQSRQLLEFGDNSTRLITDDFRTESFEYIWGHLDALQQ